jgi:hypothetical protein
VLLATGALTAPLGMPLLPVESFIKYQNALGLRPSSGERHAEGELPSFFANMFGWERLAATVDAVYRSLPAADQVRCGIFCQSYVLAGAVDFYGKQYHLPRAISGHNNYWLWGLQGYSGDVLIVVGLDAATLREYFVEVTEQALFQDKYVLPNLNNLPVFVVRKPKQPAETMWAKVKNYI